ncbi:uncharacterized protein PITG_15535 [Phytophthora infestans T30-4]|uniref:Uncharacterized protein n=1 Tax=Phytophthora infestans (strain T30-4) TaxID=403677 RepID=D0NT94_PHYIT|nr:uncharacterized protein PITG_15535 [Phytophthora infestans T30-4]EEY64762.1 hypothetical protein PITG_15535 [Phytophthora infestans T30-4]|eukprot:XP_002897689.1 hypothetical protein PITG_15535 [Phytophthora infestans T30-4]
MANELAQSVLVVTMYADVVAVLAHGPFTPGPVEQRLQCRYAGVMAHAAVRERQLAPMIYAVDAAHFHSAACRTEMMTSYSVLA